MYERCRLTTLLSVRPSAYLSVTVVDIVETTQYKIIELVFVAW